MSKYLCLLMIVAAVAAPASRSFAADGPVASDPVFVVLTTRGESIPGRIRQFQPDGKLTFVTTEGPERTFPVDTLVKLSREAVSPPLTPEASVVLFPDGDRLYRTSIGAAGETTLDVQSYSLGTLAVPLESILGLVFTLPTDTQALDAAVDRVRQEPRNSEVLWLANGDRQAIGFLGLTDKVLNFQADKKPQTIDRSRVVAVGFDPSLVVYPKPDSGWLELTLADGSRLGVTSVRIEQGQFQGTTRFGLKIKVPIAEVLRIHCRSRAVDYLGERPPLREKRVPYLGVDRPTRSNATVEGHPFKVGGQEFDRGLGTSSRTLLAYRIEPTDQRFQASVALDDRAGPLGNVVFRVLVDNQERFASPPMSAGDPPRAVDVDLKGGRILILITEYGERGGVRDLADWIEARIIR